MSLIEIQMNNKNYDDIHIFNCFSNPYGGTERRSIHLFKILNNHRHVILWCDGRPHKSWANRYPIYRIDANLERFPRNGIFVFVGDHLKIGEWLYSDLVFPNRIILLCTSCNKNRFEYLWSKLKKRFGRIDLIFGSKTIRDHIGEAGLVQYSPIDVSEFSPVGVCNDESENVCVIGRHSRDITKKHHHADVNLYACLSENGYKINIMGGTCLRNEIKKNVNISLLRCGAMSVNHFLRCLDIFFIGRMEK